MPSLTQLEYLLAVDRFRHFGNAARACHISQPTLSMQLQKLEDEVGIVFFDRLKKPIRPTPQGERYIEQARAVLRERDKLLHVSKQVASGDLAGDFKLGIIPTISHDLLPQFLKSFSARYPKVDLYIEEMKTETIISELEGDRLDGAILATPIGRTDFKIHPLYYEPFYVYLSPKHPLLKKSMITRDELDATQMWLLQDGHCFKDQVLSFCALPATKESALSNVHFRSGSLDTLRRLVRAGQGYTLIPAMMALALDKREFDAHVRPFKAPAPAREISFIYRRDHWKLEVVRALEEAIAQSLPPEISAKPTRGLKVLEAC